MYNQLFPNRFATNALLTVTAAVIVFMLGLSVGETGRLQSFSQGWHADQHVAVYGRYGHFTR